MKKILFLSFIMYITILGAKPASNLEEAKNATVYIKQLDMQGNPVSSGTGFFINDYGALVTNFHVIEPYFKIKIYLYDINTKGRSEDASYIIEFNEIIILNYDATLDLAILQITSSEFFASKRENNYIVIPEKNNLVELLPALAIGFPAGGLDWTVTDGKISSTNDYCIQVTTPINPGNSGGPLLDPNSFFLLGINVAKVVGNDNTGFAIPIECLKELIDNVPNFSTNLLNLRLSNKHSNMINDFVKYECEHFENTHIVTPKNISLTESDYDNGTELTISLTNDIYANIFLEKGKRTDFINVFNKWDQSELAEILAKDKKSYKELYDAGNENYHFRVNNFTARFWSVKHSFYKLYWAFNFFEGKTYFIYSKKKYRSDDKLGYINDNYNNFICYLGGIIGDFHNVWNLEIPYITTDGIVKTEPTENNVDKQNNVLSGYSGIASAHFNMGKVYSEKGEYHKAIEHFLQTIEINPDVITGYELLGNIYQKKSKYDKAIVCYKEILEIDPNNQNIVSELVNTYNKKDNHGKIQKILE